MPEFALTVTGTTITVEAVPEQKVAITVPSSVPTVLTALEVGPQGPIGPKGDTGDQGPQGVQGPQGDTGPAGPGVASGGVQGDVLLKASVTEYDTEWGSLTASDVGAYPDSNPSNFIDAAGAPVQSVNSLAGTVVLTTSEVAEGTALYYTDARASAAAPVQSVNGGTGVVSLDYTDVGAVGTALGVYVYDYGTAIPSVRPDAAAVYWRGTAVPGTAIALPGDLWYDTTGD